RDRGLRQYPVHQGSKRSARHGPDAVDQERKREKGAGGKGDGGELEALMRSCELNRRWVPAECASTIKWTLAPLIKATHAPQRKLHLTRTEIDRAFDNMIQRRCFRA